MDFGSAISGSAGFPEDDDDYYRVVPDSNGTITALLSALSEDLNLRLYDSGGNHYKDWLDAIRKRTQPVCDVETGHRSATVCNIANIAYRLNRPLQWDPESESFGDDAEANALTRPFGRGRFAFENTN